jgi:hypothetical protein
MIRLDNGRACRRDIHLLMHQDNDFIRDFLRIHFLIPPLVFQHQQRSICDKMRAFVTASSINMSGFESGLQQHLEKVKLYKTNQQRYLV